MISEKLPECQDFVSLVEEEKLILEVNANKKYQKYLKMLPDFTFDNVTVTSFGNFVFLDKFKEFIDFKRIITKNVSFKRGDNTVYSDYDILEHMINSNLVGKHRFVHYNDLNNDPGFLRIKGEDTNPDESTCRKLLDKIEVKNITQLKKAMKSLLNKKAELDGPREVWISIDDSVSVLYGNQHNGING